MSFTIRRKGTSRPWRPGIVFFFSAGSLAFTVTEVIVIEEVPRLSVSHRVCLLYVWSQCE